jgi:S-formylglutathione hydrolase FrmB
MLVHELVPRLRDEGLRVDRIGVWGWSMGGYGALLLARESARDALGGTRVVAAAAASPALFASAAETTPGAFDGPADFAAWGDLITRPEVSRTTALRVSCGDADPFAEPTRRYRVAVDPTPTGVIGPGCHDLGYWISEAAQALPFLASHL